MTTKINGQSSSFTVGASGLYAVIIAARVRQGQDLRIEIDGRVFRELLPEKYIQKFNVPPAWNGAKLRGKTQTNIFILNLQKGTHILDFVIKNGAEILEWKLQKISNPAQAVFNFNLQAENYNRQPWINFILIDLPLYAVKADVTTAWHLWDGDDVKLIVDNQVASGSKSQWLWHASPLQLLFGEQKETKKLTPNLDTGVHYLEFWADQTPTLHQVVLDMTMHFNGDYRCRATTRDVYKPNENKAVLGVYFPSGHPAEINNDNIEVYLGTEKLKLGIHNKINPLDGVFNFSTHIADNKTDHDETNDNWFYYGIDTSWKLLHSDWQDDDKWKIIKK
jgi:hypothetical protein